MKPANKSRIRGVLAKASPPATVEDLRAALDAIFEDARQQAVYLVDAFVGAGEVSTPAGAPVKPSQPPEREQVKSRYRPRAALYQLAQDTVETFHAERGRRPSAREILERMPAHDSDHWPVSPRLEGKTIYWVDCSGEKRTTSLKAFRNQMSRIPV